MLGSEGVSDVMPSQVPGVVQPIHQLTLVWEEKHRLLDSRLKMTRTQ